MATFEGKDDGKSGSLEYKKYPLRRMEPAIQKFLKVIQIDLARLHRHRLNVEKVIFYVTLYSLINAPCLLPHHPKPTP